MRLRRVAIGVCIIDDDVDTVLMGGGNWGIGIIPEDDAYVVDVVDVVEHDVPGLRTIDDVDIVVDVGTVFPVIVSMYIYMCV